MFLVFLIVFAISACAQESDNTAEKSPPAAPSVDAIAPLPTSETGKSPVSRGEGETDEAATTELLKARLTMALGGMPIKSITPSPVPNIYQVLLAGEVLYISADGRFVFAGNLIDLEQQVNLTEQAQVQGQLEALKAIPKEEMVVFPAKIQQRQLWVFTDIECPYCRRLHQEVPELNRNGITVNYLFFPRSGPNTPSFQKSIRVWCANDRQQAMNRAKNQEVLPNLSCENKVMDQYLLTQSLGINGTPYMVSDNGRRIPGFAPAVEIIRALR